MFLFPLLVSGVFIEENYVDGVLIFLFALGLPLEGDLF
jgi:hypothetical protein